MQNTPHSQERWLRSARALLAYYEHKFSLQLELVVEEPAGLSVSFMSLPQEIRPFGFCGVKAARPLHSAEQTEMLQTFSSVFGSIQSISARHHGTLRLHNSMERLPIEKAMSNVIPLRPLTKARNPFPDIQKERWGLRHDCLIESRHAVEVHKMAFELYSQGARYAFLEYSNLDLDQRLDLNSLLKMGAVVLFVPSLLTLSSQEQATLNTLILISTVHRPLVIAGTPVHYAELRSQPGISAEFVENLARAYLKLTKPFAEYKRDGLIQYFLDSLSHIPT